MVIRIRVNAAKSRKSQKRRQHADTLNKAVSTKYA